MLGDFSSNGMDYKFIHKETVSPEVIFEFKQPGMIRSENVVSSKQHPLDTSKSLWTSGSLIVHRHRTLGRLL
ncbi:hypothetical protein Tco_0555988 [Tanacetum coccineum]